jgi:actin-related protein
MEKIYHYTYMNALKAAAEDLPIVLTDSSSDTKVNREMMTKIMFETFFTPAMYVTNQAVLSLYATGRSTGVVMECGGGVMQSVPIYEGHAIPHGINQLDAGGNELTKYLTKLMEKSGYSWQTVQELEIARDIKENLCYIAKDYEKERNVLPSTLEKEYRLPDGNYVYLSSERFKCTEALFQPNLMGNLLNMKLTCT